MPSVSTWLNNGNSQLRVDTPRTPKEKGEKGETKFSKRHFNFPYFFNIPSLMAVNNFVCFCVIFSSTWQLLVAQECSGVAVNCLEQFSPVRLSYYGAQKDQQLIDDPLRFTNYGNVTGKFKFYAANKALAFYPNIEPGNNPIPFILNRTTKPEGIRRHLHPRIYGSSYGINGYVLYRIDFRRGFDPDLQLGSDHLIGLLLTQTPFLYLIFFI